jgi:glycosyltransferase involved in cell wall biosynthesis
MSLPDPATLEPSHADDGAPTAPKGDFPRLLFITASAFNRVTGSGITFTNLFHGWPRERIATIHNDPVPTSTEICDRYYQLSAREIRRFPPFRRERAATVADDGTAGAAAMGLLRAGKQVIFGDGLPEWGRLSPELRAWIGAFRPELVYTALGSNAILDLVKGITMELATPLAIHFMDDWQSAIYRGGLLSFLQRGKMRRRLRWLVDAAALRLAIGDAMASEYARRFAVPFLAFQNAVAANRWSISRGDVGAVGSPTRIVYTGSVLGFAQAESLATCCAAVARLRRGGANVRLDIYSPSFQIAPIRHRFEIDECVRIHDTIDADDTYFRVLAEADILLLPANFDAASVRYIRLSMPTKIPAYLASGTPILVYGPREISQVEYARRAGWGMVVDEPMTEALVGAIRTLLENAALRRRLSETARRLAAAHHDIRCVGERFQRALIDAARQPAGIR